MYTLQVMYQRRWKWGMKQYETLADAQARVKELSSKGIKSRIRLTSELYGG